MAWLSGYRYRKSFSLSRPSGSVTDYQMKILVGESSGATGEDVDCGAEILSNFNDLRFTTSDGQTLLEYWIESVSGVSPNQLATVWVKFSGIGTGDTYFYMYYGNAGASAVTSGSTTFPFFDDFPGSSVDSSKWTITGAGWSVAAGILSCTDSGSQRLECKTSFGNGYAVRTRASFPKEASSAAMVGFFDLEAEIWDNGAFFDLNYYDGSSHRYTSSAAHGAGYKIQEVRRLSSTLTHYYVDDALALSQAVGSASELAPDIYSYQNIITGVDWILVRKIEATEPTWGAWGSEEVESLDEAADISDEAVADHLVDVAAESGDIADTVSGATSEYLTTVPESADISDVSMGGKEILEATAEAGDISDVADGVHYYYRTLTEALILTDENICANNLFIYDAFFTWDEANVGWNFTSDESLVLTDTLAISLGLLISDWLTMIDSQSNNWNGSEVVAQALNLFDIAEKYFSVTGTINESLVLTDANLYSLTVSVLEYLGFEELAAAMRTGANTINDSLVLTDAADKAWQMIINEALVSVDSISVLTSFVGAISEALGLTETLSSLKRIYPSISESLVFTEAVSNQGTFSTAVYETLRLNVIVTLGGEVYECYALNTPKFYPSMYSGFDFNSYCVFENRAFGANDTGIYELTGTTDAGSTIHTGVALSETDFGSRNQKRFRRAYLGISGTSPVMVCETDDGQRRVYNIDTQGKTVISHELKSREWKLSIAEFDELDTIKLIPIILSK